MNRIVLITGPMRSGTSLVAQVVHLLGFPVALMIAAPLPPSWRSDWEDLTVTAPMMEGERIDWRDYFERRIRASKMLGLGGRVALKSPFLAIYREEIEKAVEDPFWILCERDEVDTRRSLRAHPQLDVRDQARIKKALSGLQPDYRFSYFMRRDEVPILAGALGVTDQSAIDRAIASVGEPTEYLCLQ